MREPGFVYALINASMTGLVKVGRTARDPAGRADELSRATGVPTTFVLAYQRFFLDNDAAERFVHTFLERRGYRVSANREFFRAPLEEVVEAILQAPGGASEVQQDSSNDDAPVSHQRHEFLDSLTGQDHPAWEGVFEEAEDHYYGLGSVLQDYPEALRLYKQAASLGASKAYLCLGKMHRDGEGCTQNNSRALEYLKEGARCGDVNCYAEMADLFVEEEHLENARKCWDRYFACPPADTVGWYGYRYFTTCRKRNWPISYVDELRKHFPELLHSAEKMCSISRSHRDSSSLIGYYDEVAVEIKQHFGPRPKVWAITLADQASIAEERRAALRAMRDKTYRARGIEPGPWAWFHALPDVVQAVLLGLVFAVPALAIAIIFFRWLSGASE